MYTKHQLRHFFKFSINKCFPIKKKIVIIFILHDNFKISYKQYNMPLYFLFNRTSSRPFCEYSFRNRKLLVKSER